MEKHSNSDWLVNYCGVLITFFGKNKIYANSRITDKPGRILILEVMINESKYILVNIYNTNTEINN